jgi:hypothetical protein
MLLGISRPFLWETRLPLGSIRSFEPKKTSTWTSAFEYFRFIHSVNRTLTRNCWSRGGRHDEGGCGSYAGAALDHIERVFRSEHELAEVGRGKPGHLKKAGRVGCRHELQGIYAAVQKDGWRRKGEKEKQTGS